MARIEPELPCVRTVGSPLFRVGAQGMYARLRVDSSLLPEENLPAFLAMDAARSCGTVCSNGHELLLRSFLSPPIALGHSVILWDQFAIQ